MAWRLFAGYIALESSMSTTQLRILRTKLREFATSFESVWTAKKESSGVEDCQGDCSNSLGIFHSRCFACSVELQFWARGIWIFAKKSYINKQTRTGQRVRKQKEELKQTFQQKEFIEQNRKS